MENIAIVTVAYNRVKSLSRLLNSLLCADIDNAPLIISIDKSNTNEVERYANDFIWPYGEKKVITHKENLGLRKHILSIGQLLDYYDAVIVLEDDIIVAPGFYKFAVAATKFYCNDNNIAGISLYNYPFNYQTFEPFDALKSEYDVYFMQIAMSWGQVWMRDSWRRFYNWYEQTKHNKLACINNIYCFKEWGEKSWLKYHIAYCIDQNKYFVYPYSSYSTNCADKGTHVTTNLFVFQSPLKWSKQENTYRFPTFPNGVNYDSYNENRCLYETLQISEADLILDLSDNLKKFENKRYILTTKKMNYQIVKKFALELRPIELNVIMNNEGEGIYLYDSSNPIKNNEHISKIDLLSYKCKIHSLLAILNKIGIYSLFCLFIRRIIKRK